MTCSLLVSLHDIHYDFGPLRKLEISGPLALVFYPVDLQSIGVNKTVNTLGVRASTAYIPLKNLAHQLLMAGFR